MFGEAHQENTLHDLKKLPDLRRRRANYLVLGEHFPVLSDIWRPLGSIKILCLEKYEVKHGPNAPLPRYGTDLSGPRSWKSGEIVTSSTTVKYQGSCVAEKTDDNNIALNTSRPL